RANQARIVDGADRLVIAAAETVAPDGQPVQVITTHFARPLQPAVQAGQRRALAAFAAGFDKSSLVLAGDFKLTPVAAATREQDAPLAPRIRRTKAVFTWPATLATPRKPAPFALLPIDHIYAGPAWRTLTVQRLRRTPSDHYGVMAVLARRAG